jgi:tetratricopeptide (TPR) repeat protein
VRGRRNRGQKSTNLFGIFLALAGLKDNKKPGPAGTQLRQRHAMSPTNNQQNSPRLWRLGWILLAVGLTGVVAVVFTRQTPSGDQFIRLMSKGNGFLEQGDATNAISAYLEAIPLAPESLDAKLNLANAYLLAGDNRKVIEQCQQALSLDHNSAAAYYLMGCAYLHLNEAEKAVQAFQDSKQIDPAITALNFQLGLAEERLGHLDDAIREFETIVQFEPDHPSAHYQLSRLYQRVGRTAEAAQEMQKHQQILAKSPVVSGPAVFERCKYTQPRMAFSLAQPSPKGVPVKFVDATSAAFSQPSRYHGPFGVLDFNHDGRNSLFVTEGDKGFRLLNNSQSRFEPVGEVLPAKAGASYRRCLVGDLNNDRFEDVLVLGEQDSRAFKFATNGQARDVTTMSGLRELKAQDGVLADLDFTGKLDLLSVLPGGQGLRVYRNLGNFYFKDNTTNSGLPEVFPGTQNVIVDDWFNEDLPGIFVTRTGQPPVFFSKQRAGIFVQTNAPDWPVGTVVATGDLNNDLRTDLVIAGERELTIVFGGLEPRITVPLSGLQVKGLLLFDYDNDGWLDILAYGNGVRVWRNRGKAGFADTTADLGLTGLGTVDGVAAADFDNDGDDDLVFSSSTGLQYWRNDGGNANKQLKLRLEGNRSNASALGVRVELASGRWHTIRTLQQLPFEIGVDEHDKLDVLKVHWSDLATTLVDVPVETNPLTLVELTLPTGSCPYLYTWNGKQFEFVTDILGASPLGLPVSESHFVEADPEEFLEMGDPTKFPTRNGRFELRITEELREVLYLDCAKLVAVDHPSGTLVHPTSKMHPGRPFPPHELWTLRPIAPIKRAIRSDGLDVTAALACTDRIMVTPVRLREPQLRGLAEPFSVTMDFGELPLNKPLVLVLNGWLRFGGGMANVAGSLDPNLPFPFPTLDAELADGSWNPVPVDVGVPAGKTKTIIVDLDKKLPSGTRRLRLSTAFELYWDSAQLCEKAPANQNQVTWLRPEQADLHWRGFSRFAPLPAFLPLTPNYDNVQSSPPWNRTPSGWCTRYGPVEDLVNESDDALALLNGGDEVALSFNASQLPATPEGFVRDFFLYVVGWDKDADFHVGQGWRVEPLPFAGMEDQTYGHTDRPADLSNSWINKYNTRWVGPLVLKKEQQ